MDKEYSSDNVEKIGKEELKKAIMDSGIIKKNLSTDEQ